MQQQVDVTFHSINIKSHRCYFLFIFIYIYFLNFILRRGFIIPVLYPESRYKFIRVYLGINVCPLVDTTSGVSCLVTNTATHFIPCKTRIKIC